jgi:hypothetical protein
LVPEIVLGLVQAWFAREPAQMRLVSVPARLPPEEHSLAPQ